MRCAIIGDPHCWTAHASLYTNNVRSRAQIPRPHAHPRCMANLSRPHILSWFVDSRLICNHDMPHCSWLSGLQRRLQWVSLRPSFPLSLRHRRRPWSGKWVFPPCASGRRGWAGIACEGGYNGPLVFVFEAAGRGGMSGSATARGLAGSDPTGRAIQRRRAADGAESRSTGGAWRGRGSCGRRCA